MALGRLLSVVDARKRLWASICLDPVGEEWVSLEVAWGRVLSCNVVSGMNIPGFDRSNVDGYAVRAEDASGSLSQPIELQLTGEVLDCGVQPKKEVSGGLATEIATGGILPKGADAVVMLEYTRCERGLLLVERSVTAGEGFTHTGSDLACGETALDRQVVVTARETAVLSALGMDKVLVYKRPKVAILSTGNELSVPGKPLTAGRVYDSNGYMLADAVREQGGEPVFMGIFPDDEAQLEAGLRQALAECDLVLLSGGSSKGKEDINHQVVAKLKPGIFVHGVTLKPGRPLCLAAAEQKLVAILPGFPSSAAFTFYLMIAPVLRKLTGRLLKYPEFEPDVDIPIATNSKKEASSLGDEHSSVAYSTFNSAERVRATLPMGMKSASGRTEFTLVYLTEGRSGLNAWPLDKGSGSVSAFSRADGFIVTPQQQQWLEVGSNVEVHLLNKEHASADLVVIGSHCLVLDKLLALFSEQGWGTRYIPIGSEKGLQAAQRGECDLAAYNTLHETSESYKAPFLTPDLHLVKAYQRQQSFIFRKDDPHFVNKTLSQALHTATSKPEIIMVNRNRSSTTRTLINSLIGKQKPRGFLHEAQSQQAVVAAILQGRADWGIATTVATVSLPLESIPITADDFNLIIPKDRLTKLAVQAFLALLPKHHQDLVELNVKPYSTPKPS